MPRTPNAPAYVRGARLLAGAMAGAASAALVAGISGWEPEMPDIVAASDAAAPGTSSTPGLFRSFLEIKAAHDAEKAAAEEERKAREMAEAAAAQAAREVEQAAIAEAALEEPAAPANEDGAGDGAGPIILAESASSPMAEAPSSNGVETAGDLPSRDTVRDPVTTSLYVSGYCGSPDCAQSSVDSYEITLIDYTTGLLTIAGHNYGPAGVIATLGHGSVVSLDGVVSGIHRVVETRYVGMYDTTESLRAGLALQTCVDGSTMVIHYIEPA